MPGSAYATLLDPPLSKPDVTFWLNTGSGAASVRHEFNGKVTGDTMRIDGSAGSLEFKAAVR